jgi:hypothetical protein
MKLYSSGWHTIAGYTCWVEDGTVRRAILGEGNDQTTGYPYRRTGDGSWTSATPTPDTLRAGLARGTYAIK